MLENSDTDITTSDSGKGLVGAISMLEIDSIEANPFNPRTNFERDALEELSASIATHGIIQPLTVRKLGRDRYQLISGERRFRASQLAGLKEVPAYVRVANDQAMLEMALVENIQRQDLNPIEVALSYQRLIEECNLTQDQLGQKVAKSRSSITNHLRLLKLPAEIQAGVKQGLISMGHARALVSAKDEELQSLLYERTVEDELSVRELEALMRGEEIRKGSSTTSVPGKSSNSKKVMYSSDELTFKDKLSNRLDTKVDLKKSPGGSGKIIVSFNSEMDLNRIMELLKK